MSKTMEGIKRFDYKDLFADSAEPVFKNLLAEMISGSGAAKAQWLLGRAYYEGEIALAVDYDKAAFLFSESAGNSLEEDAFYGLGLCYHEGKGVARDEEKAIHWLEKAAAGGQSDAVLLLDEIEERDKIRGCLIGGAAGDVSGQATVMTLFTAHGLLVGATRGRTRGIAGPPESYIWAALREWMRFQTGEPSPHDKMRPNRLLEIPAVRAAGSLDALSVRALSGTMGSIEEPVNGSKGSAGVVRVAPIALFFKGDSFNPILGAKAAALTHGHPLGYLPAMALVFILHRIVYGGCTKGDTLYDIVDECCEFLDECCNLPLFHEARPFAGELLDKITLAQELSRNNAPDTQNIPRIGGGRTGDEALAIAIYCSLKYYDDFSAAIISATNHNGDIDSTGSITGNIVGAHTGYANLPAKWKQNLGLHDLILEIADDITHAGPMDAQASDFDSVGMRKYSC